VARQAKLKYLAAQADARWDAKPKVMDIPVEEKALPQAGAEDAGLKKQRQDPEKNKQESFGNDNNQEENPWAKAKAQGPSEKWQPEAWTPSAKK
jgi:NADH dehydrogenase [ubiquinone] 1 alpha subcomplex assembly factor 2